MADVLRQGDWDSPDGMRATIGAGAVKALADTITEATGTPCDATVLAVVGGGFACRPWKDRVLDTLSGFRVVTVAHVGAVTPASVRRLAASCRRVAPQAIVAVGGGSVLDAAKSAAVLATRPEMTDADVIRLATGGVPGTGIPVVAVPTTPGTGAEATPFATLWDLDGGRKLSLAGAALHPAAAVLDRDLLVGLPYAVLAGCVFDTLAQGMEAAWSIKSDPQAERHGLASVSGLAGLLHDACWGVENLEIRLQLLTAGHQSGQAIARAGTTVCHALSYPLTLGWGLAHGAACGSTLAAVLTYNAAVDERTCADPRGAAHVRGVIDAIVRAAGADSVDALSARIRALVSESGVGVVRLSRAEAYRVVEAARTYNRAGSNPRRLDVDALVDAVTAANR